MCSEDRKTEFPIFSIFLRLFLLQTLMNYTRMQGLGFGMAFIPVARSLRLKGRSLSVFLRRHLDFFNAHPYLASYALGAASKLESERRKAGEIIELKNRLMGPLGLLGDQIFWSRIKPMCSGLAVVALLHLSWPPISGFRLESALVLAGLFIIYNALHFQVKWNGLVKGYRNGENVPIAITGSAIVKLRLFLGLGTALVSGLYLAKTYSISQENDAAVFLSAFVVVIISRSLKLPVWLTLILALTVSLAVSFFTEAKLLGQR